MDHVDQPRRRVNGVKSLPIGWAVAWAVWSVLTLLFVALRILPALAEFMDLVDRHPAMMLQWRGALAFGSLFGWFVLGLLALIYLLAFFRRWSD